ncbi:MAG: hypothetical protein DWQ31_19195 [Planctomycetota bacterium]|nr:MAG: hypothetical protein DWQ31_19195 [Planctomycetota bacterium]REJ88038.1 MAG: hypothetical protein DWQ35_20425 [Planctomycetota bacterium]REK27110.1 MAG: hypothetical protein DWQ42_07685 [Planctomycetota bacterium]REK38248.1 MAG: hypothetical protein DWQ46_20775 [Planctomycetota bacterium]
MGTKTEPFSAVHESGDCLESVHGYFFVDQVCDDLLVAVRLKFDDEIVVLTAEEDDTIGVFGPSWRRDSEDVELRGLSGTPPWTSAIGKPLLWSWTMTNQLGYFDGVQIQFGTNVENAGVQVQLLVVASEIKVRII